MAKVVTFTFNAFQENMYLVYDDTKECIIFDPGCSNDQEEAKLISFIEEHNLKPVRLINTHCHLDHVFGNKFISEKYNLPLEGHKDEAPVLAWSEKAATQYGLSMKPSPPITKFIEEGDIIEFGNTKLVSLFTPGHSPASLSFYCKEDKFIIAGDVLFHSSIGRTDLPGGNFDTLINSIKTQFFPLGDDVVVYPGHMQSTTIGFEKAHNPFL